MATVSTAENLITCAGRTRSGARCKRRARPGERYCQQHAAAATTDRPGSSRARRERPSDIDASEFDAIIDELTGGHGFAEMAGIASSAWDELRGVGGVAQGAARRVLELAHDRGIIRQDVFEQVFTDATHALVSVTSAFADRLSGDYEEDDFGFDPAFTEALVPLFDLLYRYWWRVDAEGVDNVPADGRVLLVANHAGGGLPFDGAMMKLALLHRDRDPRHLRILVLDWLMGLPYLADMMRATGQALACSENATALLENDQAVAVFPEGVKGMVKPFSQRYTLKRFGRGGFVRIALRTGSPIVPVAVVGSEEIYPKIGNIPIIPRLIGAPFVPMTPTFPWLGVGGLVPLPSKWIIEFCDPIDVTGFGPEAAEDRSFVLELSEQIRVTIQERVRANLLKRSTPFW